VEAIDAQAHLMSDLIHQFGSPELALAAYNAGPAPVEACNCVPAIPETSAYVARIMALLGGSAALRLPHLRSQAGRMSGTTCITRDTLFDVTKVTIRELRNQGGEVVDRAASGEQITITRSGRPVAELRPLRAPLSADAVLERARRLPEVDPVTLREDIDRLLDWTL
jgi:prevent-host-death family protein